MHKAISIIQFKVEGQIIRKQSWSSRWKGRNLLHRIDFEKGTIRFGWAESMNFWIRIFQPLTQGILMTLTRRRRGYHGASGESLFEL